MARGTPLEIEKARKPGRPKKGKAGRPKKVGPKRLTIQALVTKAQYKELQRRVEQIRNRRPNYSVPDLLREYLDRILAAPLPPLAKRDRHAEWRAKLRYVSRIVKGIAREYQEETDSKLKRKKNAALHR
jgi:hypothetical protein